MKVFKLNSDKLVSIKISNYLIDWNSAPSKGQQQIQDFLYPLWKHYIILAELRVPGSLFRFDIVNCNKRMIIEYSPKKHHEEFNKFFHKTRAGYLKAIKADMKKILWAEQNNFTIIHLTENDLKHLSVKYFKEKFNIDII